MHRGKKKDNGMKEEENEYNNPMKKLYKKRKCNKKK
jgi:hypothetical protein